MRYILIAVMLSMSVAAIANENRLGLSLVIQQDSTDNYLMSESDSKNLYGVYVKPKISYRHENGYETFSVDAQESVERYDISDYNIENPSFSTTYRRVMERSLVEVGYDKSVQSTLISEFKDSGNILKESSSQTTSTSKVSWNYSLTKRDIFAINTSLQTIKYDSEAYADLTNKSAQFSLQHELTEVASMYAALSVNQYKSLFSGAFPIAPQEIQGYLLCPPGSLLISDDSCAYLSSVIGNAENITTSTGFQVGGKWSIQEQLLLSFSAGASDSKVEQHISMPVTSVEFGPPIDDAVSFGGERTLRNNSMLTTANVSLSYQREASMLSLLLTRQIQPSSNGGLWKTETVEGIYHLSLSDISWVDFDLLYEKFLTFDEKVVSASRVDRNIFYGSIKYGRSFSHSLTGTVSLGYKRQESNLSRSIVADAMLGAVAINYTPKEWAW